MFESIRHYYKKKTVESPSKSGSMMGVELLKSASTAAYQSAHLSNQISMLTASQLSARASAMFPESGMFAVFLPNNRFLEGWDLIMVLLLAYTGVVSPVDAAFLPTRFDAIFFINRLLDISFFIDLMLQFNIAYVAENGVGLVKNRRKIAVRYLCGWFCFDLFSVCPFDLLNFMVSADVTNLQALKTLRLAKMLRLLRANRLFERIEVRMAVNYSACRLYAFGVMLFMFIHWFACGWFMVIDFENNEECIEISTGECCYNWRDCYSKQQETSTGDYFLSIYWSSSEVLTTTSDVYPVTDLERSYQLLIRVLCGVVYAYLIGAVCSIFTALERDRNEYFDSMDRLNEFLAEKTVTKTNPELCTVLRLFYRFSYAYERSSASLKQIMQKVSPSLQGQLSSQVHRKWLENFPIFKNVTLSPAFHIKLAMCLETMIVGPMEPIIEPYQTADKLYIIEKGIVMGKNCRVYRAGDYIGEESLFNFGLSQRGYQVTSMTHGHLSYLLISRLRELLDPNFSPTFKRDHEAFAHQVVLMKVRALAFQLGKAFRRAVSNTVFPSAIQLLREDMDWVAEPIFRDFVQSYFKPYWMRWHPFSVHKSGYINLQKVIKTFASRQERRRRERRRRLWQILPILEPVGLESYADVLVNEELDSRLLRKCTPSELHSMGLKMGHAIALCEHMAEAEGMFTQHPISKAENPLFLHLQDDPAQYDHIVLEAFSTNFGMRSDEHS